MARLDETVERVRSKNAGPFWITVDIFCDSPATMERIAAALDDERVAALLGIEPARLRRFELPHLAVLKFSFVRPVVQGGSRDRDMHGAQVAVLFESLEV